MANSIFNLINRFFDLSTSDVAEEHRICYCGIYIYGQCVFLNQTKQALSLLSKNTSHFEFIQQYVHTVRRGRRYYIDSNRKTSDIFINGEPWSLSLIWYAGVIAHEAYENYLFNQALAGKWCLFLTGDNDWIGKEAQKRSLLFLIDVLADLGADNFHLIQLKKELNDPIKCGFWQNTIIRLLKSGRASQQETSIYGFEVIGEELFLIQTERALRLLSRTNCFDVIMQNIRLIRQGSRPFSYVQVNRNRSVAYFDYKTWTYSPIWYAGGIAHEAYHNVLYRRYLSKTWWRRLFNEQIWYGDDAEYQCSLFEMKVLAELGADADIMNHLNQRIMEILERKNKRKRD